MHERFLLGRRHGLRREIGSLEAQQVGGQLARRACEEAPGVECVDRAVEVEVVRGDDADDVLAHAVRVAEPFQDPVRERGADRRVASAVCGRLRLAEVVKERGEAYASRVAPLSAAFWATAKMCSSSGTGCRRGSR